MLINKNTGSKAEKLVINTTQHFENSKLYKKSNSTPMSVSTDKNNKTQCYRQRCASSPPTTPTSTSNIDLQQQEREEQADHKIFLTPPSSPEATATNTLPASENNNNNQRYRTKNNRKIYNGTYEYNNRILAAKRNGNVRAVMNEFVSMKKNNVQTTHHTYNLVLESHAILRREGTPLTTMLKVYNEMITQAQIQPNAYTYTLMLRTLCKRDVEVQKTVAMLKRQSIRIGQPNFDVGLLESEDSLNKALAIFQAAVSCNVRFDIDINNQLLRVLSHYGDTTNAIFVYQHIAQPNSATYAALINLFGRAGDIDMALYYYHTYCNVKDCLGVHDASYIFNALVDCHLKCGRLEEAIKIVEKDMVEHEISLSCIPYNSVIRHYCAHEQTLEAEQLTEKLVNQHKEKPNVYPIPDASSYGPILSTLCQKDKYHDATRVYNLLRKTDIRKAYGNLANYALMCLNYGDRCEALAVIEDMSEAGLEPDAILCERIVVAFAEAKEIEKALDALELLQTLMSTRSLVKGTGHILTSAAEIVRYSSNLGQMLRASKLIDPLIKDEATLFAISKALIECYFEQELVIDRGLTLQDFQTLFDSVFVCQDWDYGKKIIQLLEDMRACQLSVSEDLYHSVLNQLNASNDIESTSRWITAFETYVSKTHSTDNLTSCSSSCCVSGEEETEDDDDIEIQVASEDQKYESLMPLCPSSNRADDVSNLVFNALQRNQAQEAIRIFEDKIICCGLIPSPEIMRDVIALAGKSGDIQTALALYNNSIYAYKNIPDVNSKDEAIYMATNSILIGYAQKGNMDQAKVYYDRIKAQGRVPDSHGYASLLLGSAKCATDEATDALAIYDEAKRHQVKPTTFFYNVIISKLAKTRKLDAALSLFEEMHQFKIPVNSITYGAIISASVRSGSETQSRRLFGEMLSSPSYQPRVGPFNNMMQFYVHQCPNRERVLEYFGELRRRHIKPSPHSYKLLMEAYTHIAPYDMPMAHRLLGDMERCDHIHPQATHYSTLMYSYGILQRDVQSTERVFTEMKRHKIYPDEAVYQALIDTFISNNALEKAEDLYYGEMSQTPVDRDSSSSEWSFTKSSNKKKKPKSGSSPYIENLFIRGYGEKGQLDKAEKIFYAMSDDKKNAGQNRVIREPSSYEAMVRAYIENQKIEKAKEILDKMAQRDFPAKVISVVADLVLE